jgi:cytochrome c oxidase assembly factor CtaG
MANIRWGRIIAGAFCLELALIILFVPLISVFSIPTLAPFVVAGCFAVGFLVSWLFLRKVPERRPLHGALIGVLATLIYLGLGMFAPGGIGSIIASYGTLLFILANAMRIAGSIAGAFAIRR